MPEKKDHDPKAVEARRKWARDQLKADPYRRVFAGPKNLLDAMRDKFGVAIDMTVLAKIRKEALAEHGLTVGQVAAHQREHSKGKRKPAKKVKRAQKPEPKLTPSAPMAYFGKQLALVTKMLRKSLPDLRRFTMTTDDSGKTAIEYTLLQPVSGKVKL